jgi:alkylation response protein AidB-like acyl-CoA dehydrogenase
MMIFSHNDESGQTQLYLTSLSQTGVKVRNLDSMDPSKNIATLELTDVAVTRLTFEKSADEIINQLLNTAAVITAFEQFGGAEKAMQTGIEYTKNRYAFGRQVASFQAIKHKFADMFVAVELAKSNAYYAAWALSSDTKELKLASATARVSASDAYYDISKENIEVHGGMGFTWEFDCHLYYRRAQYLASVIGTQPVWQDKLVDALIANGIAA